MVMKKESQSDTLIIREMEFGEASFWLLGLSPFVCNRLAEKARHGKAWQAWPGEAWLG